MTAVRAILFSVLAGALVAPAFAQEVKKELDESCKKYQADVKANAKAMQGWPTAATLATDIAERYCSGVLPTERVSAELFAFLVTTSQELQAMGIDQKIFPFRAELEKAKPGIDAGAHIPSMPQVPPAFGAGISFGDADVMVADVSACDKALAAARVPHRIQSKDCGELLLHYKDIYAPVHHLIQRAYAREVKTYLDGIAQRWDDFLTKSRSQTALELAVNSYLWRGDKTSGMFLEPPERQWVLLHPSVVLEYVDKAVDGNRSEEGLMIEVIGMNWWQNDKWYQPSGASYALVYSDRAGLSDWANGIAVYFGNKYVLGATRRDGNTGYFISVDLLELYKDKKKTLGEYTRNLPKPK